jgi:hypothetical protein
MQSLVAAKRQIVDQKIGQHLQKLMKKHMMTPPVNRQVKNAMPFNVGNIKDKIPQKIEPPKTINLNLRVNEP